MLPEAVKSACEDILGQHLLSSTILSGGDINEARLLETAAGPVFLKMNSRPAAAAMLEAEAKGLKQLTKANVLRTPLVLGLGQAGGFAFLLLEYISEGRPGPNFWEDFGAGLAALHRVSNELFGLSYDNFIGSLPQGNNRQERWATFYIGERLQPQVKQALAAGLLWDGAERQFDSLYEHISDVCPDEPSALIHGDLWSGNFLVGPNSQPVLIDPSVCFAHREMDLAMSRLFGGFAPAFYQAYQESFPTAAGLEDRLDIYQLYYLLVHVNLFGGGYSQSVRQVIRRYIG